MDPNFLKNLNNFSNSWWPYIISFVFSAVLCIRLFMAGPSCPSKSRMDKKVVVITGAASGIGFATAKELAARGATVILTCRNLDKGKKAVQKIQIGNPDAKVVLKALDVSLMSNIRKFVVQFSREYDRVDVLINNAGIINHPHEKTIENLDVTLTTNYLGPFLLTHLMLPLLKKSKNGRIINISAAAHFTATLNPNDLNREFHPREIFGQTKLGLVLFTKHLAWLTKGSTITVNAVSPGLVRNTNHFKKHHAFEESFMTKLSVWPWKWLFLKTPREGSQTIIYAAVDPALKTVSGEYFSDCEQKKPADIAKERCLVEDIYATSCKLCALEPDHVFTALM